MKISKQLLVIFFCCLSFQISAQFSFGVRTGYIKAWENYGDVVLPPNAKIHVNRHYMSTLVNFEINKLFRVGIEPGYIHRGAACEPGFSRIGTGEFTGETKLLLDYIEFPLMISAKLPVCKTKFEVFGKIGYG
ncbi:MAG: hypothetical protein IH946_06625, partial [Bacteroidetes bacterium]|nr:hypothetical protein [Bacteroidota bacterium]